MIELPKSAVFLRDLGTIDVNSVPKGLLNDHSLKQGMYGRLAVLDGSVCVVWRSNKLNDVTLGIGDVLVVPPSEAHHIQLNSEARMSLRLYRL